MKILGIDPGSLRCGWAILDKTQLYAHGVLSLRQKDPLPTRLAEIFRGIKTVLHTHNPKILVIEKSFVRLNVASTLVLAQVRGVCLALAALEGLEIHEKTATTAKKNLTGYGHASKQQVIAMVNHIYGVVLAEDEADAVGLALSYVDAW